MPIVATILLVAILLWAGLYPTHLIFHAAQESMTAQHPPTIGLKTSKAMYALCLYLYLYLLMDAWKINTDILSVKGPDSGTLSANWEGTMLPIRMLWTPPGCTTNRALHETLNLGTTYYIKYSLCFKSLTC